MSGPEPNPPAPLTSAERALLAQRAPDGASERVVLEERLLADLTVSNMTWQGASWRGSQLERVRFVECTLHGVNWSGAKLTDVTFERCRLISCRFGDCRLDRVRFVGGAIELGRGRRARLHDCAFEDVAVVGPLFEGSELFRLHHRGGRLSWHLSGCQLTQWSLSDVKLDDARLTLCHGDSAALRNCEVAGLSWRGGRWSQLTFEGGKLVDLSLVEVEAESVALSQPKALSQLNMNDCRLAVLAIKACPVVYDLHLVACKIGRLALSQSTFSGAWVTKCELGPGSQVASSTLEGTFWDETQSRDMTFRAVTIKELLCARGARFTSLKLVDVRYASDLKLVLEGAQFDAGDRFGKAAP